MPDLRTLLVQYQDPPATFRRAVVLDDDQEPADTDRWARNGTFLMPEILDREASQAIACQNEKAVSPAQDIEEPALLVAHGSLGQRHAQVDCRLLFTRLECNHDQTATGQQLVKLLSQHQRRALDGLSELVPPDELAGACIEPKQLVVTGIDDQDRRIACNGLGRKRS